jgi:glycosyl-4,4'-diaponeurosporenoate acyltransferase
MSIVVWHLLVFTVAKLAPGSYFNEKRLLPITKWELGRSFYVKILRIDVWKNALPQHVGKTGFSKRNFTNISDDYIQKFNIEVRRSEWYHSRCIIWVLICLAINKGFVSKLLFSAVCVAANLPFILVQRYNRARISRLIKKRSKIV